MDLYAVLGVGRTASVAEIERAYRRLSRRYHPGINPGDSASEEMYRRVQEAYVVLTDTDQRRDYDLGSTRTPTTTESNPIALEGFNFSTSVDGPLAATFSELFADVFQHAAREATTPTAGADIELRTWVSFRDAAHGATVPLSVIRQERCATCLGQGRVRRSPIACPRCGGEGSRR